MWKLKSIQINNIVSFHRAEMDVEQDVATLIFGQNLDNENQKANGSGKSSLIEAIAFGLTGETLRKVKTDEIINDEYEEASVTLSLYNDFTDEEFVVEREISRSSAQNIRCTINGEPSIHSSIADYNKFILRKIGLTKDDIYSNYILCRNKYKSFFDSSDKDKKEIINRFSNGILVDESIEKLKLDLEPLGAKLDEKEQAVSRASGKMEAVNEQISHAIQRKDEQQRTKEFSIQNMRRKIAEKREEIRELQDKVSNARKRFELLDNESVGLEELEKTDKSFSECYGIVSEVFRKINLLNELSDYEEESESLSASLVEYQKQIADEEEKLKELNKENAEITNAYHKKRAEYDRASKDCEKQNEIDEKERESLKNEISKLDDKIDLGEDAIRKNTKELEELKRKLSDAMNLLHGVITCPKCNHKFSLQTEKTVPEIEKDRDAFQESIKFLENVNDKIRKENDDLDEAACKKQGEINKIDSQIREREKKLANEQFNLRCLNDDVDIAGRRCLDSMSAINELKIRVDNVNGRISNMRKRMFDDVFNIIDTHMDSGESYIKNTNESINHAEGIINSYRDRINELENNDETDIMTSLQNSKKEYEKELEIATAERDKALAEFNALKQQEAHFIAFKTHLANTKIDAISAVTNEYLERIGSDLRVVLEGFRILKSGKLRDKITVNILRNGVDCGSIEKLSAGEKTRICLASIIALQHLTNTSCDNGKGLDLIIADEILDASDIDGLMSYCEAINHLQITAFIITQNAIAENYPYKLVVTKKNGISTI